jgi:hypothetical protein
MCHEIYAKCRENLLALVKELFVGDDNRIHTCAQLGDGVESQVELIRPNAAHTKLIAESLDGIGNMAISFSGISHGRPFVRKKRKEPFRALPSIEDLFSGDSSLVLFKLLQLSLFEFELQLQKRERINMNGMGVAKHFNLMLQVFDDAFGFEYLLTVTLAGHTVLSWRVSL